MKATVLSLIFTICLTPLGVNAAEKSASEQVLLAAAAERQDRRQERGRSDERQDRRDCRQEEGRAGKDKRDCKQEEVRDGVRGNRDNDEEKPDT